MPSIPTIPILRTDDGGSVQLGRLLGSGGEARIHEIFGRPDFVAKVYHEDDPVRRAALLREKEAKIAAMLVRPPEISGKNSAIAWPASALRRNGQFLGFLMPRAQGNILFRYHNPKERRKHSPNFDWFYLHRTAHNLSAIVDAIHRADHVIADMNDQNFLVQDSALVSAVDTDSFQIKDLENRWHLCSVGRPEFTPPELQGKSFATQARGPEQDRFGLAVMIFQLLMEGSHPFRARLSLPHSVPEAQLYCIQHGHFPYCPGPGNPASPPPSGLDFNILTPLLQNLFRRCFVEGHAQPARRPTAAEWRDGLRQAETELVTCAQGHRHRVGLSACPWCARSKRIEELRRLVPPRPSQRPRVLPTILRPGSVRTTVSARPRVVPFPSRPRRAYTTSPPSSGMPGWTSAVVWLLIMMIMNLGRCSSDYKPSSTYAHNSKLPPIDFPNYDPPRVRTPTFPTPPPDLVYQQVLSVARTLRHRTSVAEAEFRPDSKGALTVDAGGHAFVWNFFSSAESYELPAEGVTAAHFSPDGNLVVTVSTDHTAQIWNLATGYRLGPPLRHRLAVVSADFSPGGRRLVTASEDGTAQVWDVGTGLPIGEPMEHHGPVRMAVFSPSGQFIATASDDYTARLWDAETGRLLWTMKQHRNKVHTVAFHPYLRRLVTASADCSAIVWDYEQRSALRKFEHQDDVRSAAFSPDGEQVVTASIDATARVWTVEGRGQSPTITQGSGVTSAVFSPRADWIATTSSNGTSGVWDASNGSRVNRLAHGSRVTSVAFSKDGNWVMSAGESTAVNIWDLKGAYNYRIMKSGK